MKFIYPKIALLLLGLMSALNMAYAQNNQHSLKRIDGSVLDYYWEKINTQPSKTLLVLLQGSECQSTQTMGKTMLAMRGVLPTADVVRVEKYGLAGKKAEDACPAAYLEHDAPSVRVADYKQVLNELTPHYQKVVLLGGSEGAVVLALLLQEKLPIDAAIALNAGGRYFQDDVLWSMQHSIPQEHLAEAKQGFLTMAQQAKRQELPVDFVSSEHGLKWWHEMLLLDMQSLWQQQNTPTLLIQALKDKDVSVPSAQKMFRPLRQQNNIVIKTYDHLDHGLNNLQGQAQIEKVLQDAKLWLAQHSIQ